MTSTSRFIDRDFFVSGYRISVRLPAKWDPDDSRVWALRGPQIKARLREACRQKFGQGILSDGQEGYRWLKCREVLPDLLVLTA